MEEKSKKLRVEVFVLEIDVLQTMVLERGVQEVGALGVVGAVHQRFWPLV